MWEGWEEWEEGWEEGWVGRGRETLVPRTVFLRWTGRVSSWEVVWKVWEVWEVGEVWEV